MPDAFEKLEAIKRLLLADLEATSDEELRKEFIEDGECPDKVAARVKLSIEDLIRKFPRAASTGQAKK